MLFPVLLVLCIVVTYVLIPCVAAHCVVNCVAALCIVVTYVLIPCVAALCVVTCVATLCFLTLRVATCLVLPRVL